MTEDLSQAFYLPNKDRRNLAILVSAHAYRVPTEHTENGTLKALGVEFEYQGQVYSVNARREVILSAGYVSSACYFTHTPTTNS